jgi:tRNA A-37 threonylcarbamoyl transferase component Bud32
MVRTDWEPSPLSSLAASNETDERAWRVVSRFWQDPDLLALVGRDRIQSETRRTSQDLVIRIPAAGGRPSAFAKLFDDPEHFRQERRGLECGWAASATVRGVGTPAILAVFEDERAIVLDNVDGPTLGSSLRHGWLLGAARSSPHFERLGRWLRAFHQSAIEPCDPRVALQHHLTMTRDNLVVAGEVLSPGERARAQALLSALSSAAAAGPADLVLCHGDFSATNLIHANGHLYVVDFAYSVPGFLELDLIGFRSSVRGLPGAWLSLLAGYGRDVSVDPSRCHLFEFMLLVWEVTQCQLEPVQTHLQQARRVVKRTLHVLRLRRWLDRHAPVYGVRNAGAPA